MTDKREGFGEQVMTNLKSPVFDIGAGLEGLSTLFQFGSIGGNEAERVAQVQNKMQETRIKAEQQSIARSHALFDVLGTSEARAGARGISLASGSFKAVQEKSISNAQHADKIADFNKMIKEEQGRQEIDEIHREANAERFGSLLNFGEGVIGLATLFIP